MPPSPILTAQMTLETVSATPGIVGPIPIINFTLGGTAYADAEGIGQPLRGLFQGALLRWLSDAMLPRPKAAWSPPDSSSPATSISSA